MPSSPEENPSSSSFSNTPRPSVEHLQGVIEQLIRYSEGYVVARMRLPGERELVTVVGDFRMPGQRLYVGQALRLTGGWRVHPRDGRQFLVFFAEALPISTPLSKASEALNTSGTARRLGCSEAAIQQLVEAGELKIDRSDDQGMLREYRPDEKQEELYFPVSEVERYLFHSRENRGWFPLMMDTEPNPTEGSETLLNRARLMSGTWRTLGIVAEGTSASYRPGRLSLLVDIVDPHPIFSKDEKRWHGVALACLRIDHLGTSISAGWISASLGHFEFEGDMMQANPQDGISIAVLPGDTTSGIDEVLTWLEAQWRRPVQRFEWTRDGETIARHWMLADTGRGLVVSGPPQIWRNPQTADSVLQIRP